MRFMISDDFKLSTVSTSLTLELLKKFGIRDGTKLEERNVTIGA